MLVVNECDVVPRLLGSPMPMAMAGLLAATATSGPGKAVMQRNVQLMETMRRYAHPPCTRTLLLKDGGAKAVPSSERGAVLHLHEALSSSLLDDHACEQYISGLELAAALAEAYSEDE